MKKISSAVLSLLQDQKGQALILVAAGMVMILGFTAIVVDAGGLYLEKSRLQKALDAAVLGGAQVLIDSDSEAINDAIYLADENGFTVSSDEVKAEVKDYIEIINKTVIKDLTFARIFGKDVANVTASARAEIKAIGGGNNIKPIAIEQGACLSGEEEDDCERWEHTVGDEYIMHFQPGNKDNDSKSGNFGFLDGEGGNLREQLINGISLEVGFESEIDTETGIPRGQIRSAIAELISQDENKDHCNSFETADKTCSRVITVAIVESDGLDVNGKKKVKIIGFAGFWIDGIYGKGNEEALYGRFIEYITDGEFGPGEDFGVYAVKLVQ